MQRWRQLLATPPACRPCTCTPPRRSSLTSQPEVVLHAEMAAAAGDSSGMQAMYMHTAQLFAECERGQTAAEVLLKAARPMEASDAKVIPPSQLSLLTAHPAVALEAWLLWLATGKCSFWWLQVQLIL